MNFALRKREGLFLCMIDDFKYLYFIFSVARILFVMLTIIYPYDIILKIKINTGK